MAKIFMQVIPAFLVLVASFSNASADSVDQNGARCNRNITYDFLMNANSKWLNADQRADLRNGKQVTAFFQEQSGYVIGYVFRTAAFDPELVMSVYTRSDQQAGDMGLGAFIRQSQIVGTDPNHPSNPHRVYYEQEVSFPYKNGHYTVENTITLKDGVYLQASKLIDSSDDSFSPRWSDGYFQASPNGPTGVFVVACNYMVPRGGSWRDTFNNLSRERVTESGIRLMQWVQRVAGNSAQSNQMRERLREMVRR